MMIPDSGFREAFVGLALAEDVEVAAGAELGEEAEPFGGVDGGVEGGEEGVVEGFEDFPLGLGSSFLAAAGQLLLVHHLGGEHHGEGPVVEFGEVDGADVAGAETAGEAEVGGEDAAAGGLRSDPVDGGPAWVGGGSVGLAVGGEVGGGGGGESGGFGAEAGAPLDVRGGGGGEAKTLEVVG